MLDAFGRVLEGEHAETIFALDLQHVGDQAELCSDFGVGEAGWRGHDRKYTTKCGGMPEDFWEASLSATMQPTTSILLHLHFF